MWTQTEPKLNYIFMTFFKAFSKLIQNKKCKCWNLWKQNYTEYYTEIILNKTKLNIIKIINIILSDRQDYMKLEKLKTGSKQWESKR